MPRASAHCAPPQIERDQADDGGGQIPNRGLINVDGLPWQQPDMTPAAGR
jgi:hypothetical protein